MSEATSSIHAQLDQVLADLGKTQGTAGSERSDPICGEERVVSPRRYRHAAAASTRSSPEGLSYERRDRARALLQTAEAYPAAREDEASAASQHRTGAKSTSVYGATSTKSTSVYGATSTSQLYSLPYGSRILYLLRQGYSDEELLRDAPLVDARMQVQDIQLARQVFNIPRPTHSSTHPAPSPAVPSAVAGSGNSWNSTLIHGSPTVPMPTCYPHPAIAAWQEQAQKVQELSTPIAALQAPLSAWQAQSTPTSLHTATNQKHAGLSHGEDEIEKLSRGRAALHDLSLREDLVREKLGYDFVVCLSFCRECLSLCGVCLDVYTHHAIGVCAFLHPAIRLCGAASCLSTPLLCLTSSCRVVVGVLDDEQAEKSASKPSAQGLQRPPSRALRRPQ